ncbi:MAG: hypothetical protein A2284_17995 [Deltaproteobacteria bacterium RIFOXYA12_FULL_61_11]|nr:MAG: hypothetical protein A2284_17995 [Deltaproteobacteria bacterium RIFOXYA12_FULL_61_11]
MGKLIDIEEWQELIVDEILVALENGEINYDDENLEELVLHFMHEKYEDEEMDEETLEELKLYLDDIAETIRDSYVTEDDDEDAVEYQ